MYNMSDIPGSVGGGVGVFLSIILPFVVLLGLLFMVRAVFSMVRHHDDQLVERIVSDDPGEPDDSFVEHSPTDVDWVGDLWSGLGSGSDSEES